MRTISSHFSRKTLEKIKGTVCCNCGIDCKENIVYHHIVPLGIGGNDVIDNIIPICTECHSIIHFSKSKGLKNQSALVKAGLEKAKANGKKLGRHQTTYKDLTDNIKEYIQKVNKGMSITEASKELNISRPTFYKYQKIYNEHQEETINGL